MFFYFRFSLGLLRPTCNRVCCHASAPEKASHRFRLCLVSLRTSLVFLDFAINSFLSRTIFLSPIPFRLVPLLLLSRLHLVFVSISTSTSLQYRRYSLIRPSSLPSFFPHFRRQFSTFITSPSSMYPRTPFLLRRPNRISYNFL